MNDLKVYNGQLPELNVNENTDLQRTKEWFEKRKGKFTGSKIKELMSCGRSTAKKAWGTPEKLIDLGEASKKYIFEKAMERKRNKVIQTPITAAMYYGTTNEDAVIELLKDKKIIKVDFKEFITDIAGASPDGYFEENDEIIGLEIKCATTWSSVYSRSLQIDQSHEDFWQVQSEMLALKTNKLLYVVAEPSESIFEPNITDLDIQLVHASPIHQQCIIKRCMIGNEAINLFLSGMNFHDAVIKACSEFDIEETIIDNKDDKLDLKDCPF